MKRIATLLLLVAGAATFASAQKLAPEIDPSSSMTALALLGSAVFVLRGRRKN